MSTLVPQQATQLLVDWSNGNQAALDQLMPLVHDELHREALATLREAMEMARRDGDHIILERVPNSIGWIHRELGDFDQAIAYDQEGAEIAGMYHITEAEANSLINLSYDHTERHEGAQGGCGTPRRRSGLRTRTMESLALPRYPLPCRRRRALAS